MKHLLTGIALSIVAVIAIYSWQTAAIIVFWVVVFRQIRFRSGHGEADFDWPPAPPAQPASSDRPGSCAPEAGNRTNHANGCDRS